ncbi:MAG TPA: LPS export ABC transporter periplasmic protein LptC [Gammaproteobacteria bacterium]|nr:LPS export ABC transporter periplasmic protein LptC [Gammaproteobacteria bacterium]
MMLSRRWPVFVTWFSLLAAAGLTSWLLIRTHGASPSANMAQSGAEQADYVLHQTTLTRYAEDGRRSYVIDAREITHLLKTDVALLTQIKLNYYPASGTSWHLRANHGRLGQHGNRLALSGQVQAHQLAVADPIRFATSTVTLLLPSERLHTEARVVVHQGHRETRGTGLAANLQTGTLSLLKDVTSRYVP